MMRLPRWTFICLQCLWDVEFDDGSGKKYYVQGTSSICKAAVDSGVATRSAQGVYDDKFELCRVAALPPTARSQPQTSFTNFKLRFCPAEPLRLYCTVNPTWHCLLLGSRNEILKLHSD